MCNLTNLVLSWPLLWYHCGLFKKPSPDFACIVVQGGPNQTDVFVDVFAGARHFLRGTMLKPAVILNRRKSCNFLWFLFCKYRITPPNFRVCARQKVPAKRFKICHILYIRKPKVAFSVFHFVLLYIFSYLMNGLKKKKKKVTSRSIEMNSCLKSNFGFSYI